MENYREQNEADVCYMEIKTKINVLCFFSFSFCLVAMLCLRIG